MWCWSKMDARCGAGPKWTLDVGAGPIWTLDVGAGPKWTLDVGAGPKLRPLASAFIRD